MNEADKLIIKQLFDYCHAVEQRIPKLQEFLEKELSA